MKVLVLGKVGGQDVKICREKNVKTMKKSSDGGGGGNQ